MHQLTGGPFLSKYKNQSSISPYKKKMSIRTQSKPRFVAFEHPSSKINESILSRIKQRTFSLSNLQSVRQSQTAKTILRQKLLQKRQIINPLKLKQTLIQTQKNIIPNVNKRQQRRKSHKNEQYITDRQEKLLLQKDNIKKINEQQINPRSLRKNRYQSERFQSKLQTNPSKLISIQSNYLSNQSKQIQLDNSQYLTNKYVKPQNQAIKRIKILRKSKDYQYYDGLVHQLLLGIKKQSQLQTQGSNRLDQKSHKLDQKQSQSQRLMLIGERRSNSLANINKNKSEQFNKRLQMRKTFTSIQSSQVNPILSINNRTSGVSFFQRKRESMIFRLSQLTSDNVYDKKITTFIQFLYKVNFSNSIYVDLSLGRSHLSNQKPEFKVKIGSGNNSLLIKSVVNRRFWLHLTNDKNQCNFIWTQATQKDIHKRQIQIDKRIKSIVQNDENCQQNESPRIRKLNYTLKSKFANPSYSEQSNKKILHQNDISDSNIAFSRSYMGLRSPHEPKTIDVISNHIPNNSIIGSKKILFKLMYWYYSSIQKIDPFIYLPQTYHMTPGDKDNQGLKMFKQIQLQKVNKVWIVKPGQNTNRGNGIQVASTSEIEKLMRYKKFHKNGQIKTYIVQKYLKPFLYQNRKFDIRHYMLVTIVNGIIKAYWYKDGYIRTSSQKFDLDDLGNDFIHLTNDAIQKQSDKYGKYQPGNKLSYTTFQRYLDSTYPQKKYNFQAQILQQMKKMSTDVMRAAFMFMDPQRKGCNFELYGLDFMIDHKFQPYLIQINANPCLQVSCPLLQRLIPIVLQHTLRLGLDPLLPPNDHYSPSRRHLLSDRVLDRLKYQLIFDQKHQGNKIRKLCQKEKNKFQMTGLTLEPEEDFFQDDGHQLLSQDVFKQ